MICQGSRSQRFFFIPAISPLPPSTLSSLVTVPLDLHSSAASSLFIDIRPEVSPSFWPSFYACRLSSRAHYTHALPDQVIAKVRGDGFEGDVRPEGWCWRGGVVGGNGARVLGPRNGDGGLARGTMVGRLGCVTVEIDDVQSFVPSAASRNWAPQAGESPCHHREHNSSKARVCEVAREGRGYEELKRATTYQSCLVSWGV